MNTFIAFLRAINVTNRFVKMDVLREQFEQAGFADVQTYIQSGNVIFSAPNDNQAELTRTIEARLLANFGFAVPTMVRSATELIEIANYDPFPHAAKLSNATSYVSFLHGIPNAEAQQNLLAKSNAMDSFHIHQRELYWLYDREQGTSKFSNGHVEKLLKTAATRRNTNTVQKIVKKYL